MNDNNRHQEIQRLRNVAHWLDDRFRVPGTNIRFGFDSLIGLLPGVGDSASALWGVYFIRRAHRLGTPMSLKSKMAMNVFVDFLVGAIPIIGDLFDVGFKSHVRNVALLDEFIAGEMEKEDTDPPRPPGQGSPHRNT